MTLRKLVAIVEPACAGLDKHIDFDSGTTSTDDCDRATSIVANALLAGYDPDDNDLDQINAAAEVIAELRKVLEDTGDLLRAASGKAASAVFPG